MDDSRGADVPGPGNPPHRGRGSQPIATATSVNQDAWVQAVLDAAVEGMIIIDEQGIVQSINPAATSVFGYTAEEVVGHNINMLMAPPFRETHYDYLRQYRETGERHVIGTRREVLGWRKDGSEVPLELSVSEVNLGQHMFIGTLKNLTERRRAEQRARQHEAELAHIGRINLLGEMATGIAHELNQPLAAIAAFTSACKSTALAEGSSPGNKVGRTVRDTVELLDQIDEQTHRAGEIIRRLRRLVHKSKPHRSTASVSEMVLDSISLIEADARLKDVTITTDLGDHLPSVLVDRIQIEQVLLNLIRNAVEAVQGRSQRVVSVITRLMATETGPPKIEVEVRDTGVGLADKDVPNVFEAFFTTKPDGMGMGLAICRSIVEAHDGKMFVAASPDGGASFRFTLPVGEE